MKLFSFWWVVSCAAFVACSQRESTSAPPTPVRQYAEAPLPFLTNAQPRLQTIKLFVGAETLTTELAMTPPQMATGMMWRTNMPDGEAMLFVFPQPHRTAFYMKNTTVPLSAAYIDPSGTILEIHDLQPRNETPVEASTENIQYVLEVPQGWFKRHNISTGAVVRSQIGELSRTFTVTRPQ